jgi:hypothetical protein
MSVPLACIQWPANEEYTGIYRDSLGTWIGHQQAAAKYRLQSGMLAQLRRAGKVRHLRIRRDGVSGLTYLNHEADLARSAAEYHRSQAERYQESSRRQAPSGELYLSPREFSSVVGISATTRDDWREGGVPILEGASLECREFPDGNGRLTPYYSERQAREIIEARTAAATELVPATVAAERCSVSARLVRQFACDGAIEAELRPARIGCRTHIRYYVSPSDLRRQLRQRRAAKVTPQTIADPISVAEASQIANVHPATINKWITAAKIRYENLGHLDRGGRRFVVSRSEVSEFAAKQNRSLSAGGEENWLYLRQVRVQFPSVTAGVLRYYRTHVAPVLGRQLRWRLINRPNGLKCRHKSVRQFWSEDVRHLSEWLQERDRMACDAPGGKRRNDREPGHSSSGRSQAGSAKQQDARVMPEAYCNNATPAEFTEKIPLQDINAYSTRVSEFSEKALEQLNQVLKGAEGIKPSNSGQSVPKGQGGRPRQNDHFVEYFLRERARYTKKEKTNEAIYLAYREEHSEREICQGKKTTKNYLDACRAALKEERKKL